MGSFTEYRKMRELAELSVQHGIDLGPLVQLSERLLLDTDLAPEEVYREFLQQAANMVGNLAGKAVTGIGNMVNQFGQGYQQGRGPQQNQQGQQGQQQVQQPQQNQQQQSGAANVQNAVKMLQNLKNNLQMLSQGNANLSRNVGQEAQVIDQITQMIQQMAQASAHG